MSLRFRFLSAGRAVCSRTLFRAVPCSPPEEALRIFRPYEVLPYVQSFTCGTAPHNHLL